MSLAGIRPGDVVEVDVRGARFMARVSDPGDDHLKRGTLMVAPFARSTYGPVRIVTSRQIVEHWRKRRSRA